MDELHYYKEVEDNNIFKAVDNYYHDLIIFYKKKLFNEVKEHGSMRIGIKFNSLIEEYRKANPQDKKEYLWHNVTIYFKNIFKESKITIGIDTKKSIIYASIYYWY